MEIVQLVFMVSRFRSHSLRTHRVHRSGTNPPTRITIYPCNFMKYFVFSRILVPVFYTSRQSCYPDSRIEPFHSSLPVLSRYSHTWCAMHSKIHLVYYLHSIVYTASTRFIRISPYFSYNGQHTTPNLSINSAQWNSNEAIGVTRQAVRAICYNRDRANDSPSGIQEDVGQRKNISLSVSSLRSHLKIYRRYLHCYNIEDLSIPINHRRSGTQLCATIQLKRIQEFLIS